MLIKASQSVISKIFKPHNDEQTISQATIPKSRLLSLLRIKKNGKEVLNFPCLYLEGSALYAKIRTPFGSRIPPTRKLFCVSVSEFDSTFFFVNIIVICAGLELGCFDGALRCFNEIEVISYGCGDFFTSILGL